MDIIFHGKHTGEAAANDLLSVIQLLKEHYHIVEFREMHLSLTLVDAQGYDVELVDSKTSKAYRILDVYQKEHDFLRVSAQSKLKLVIDNT